MINQNNINQAKRRRCKIGCMRDNLFRRVEGWGGGQDGVQCWRKRPNNLRKPMKCRKVINDVGMFVS